MLSKGNSFKLYSFLATNFLVRVPGTELAAGGLLSHQPVL